MANWRERGFGDADASLAPEWYAGPTDRSGYDPYEGHPARSGGLPGAGDGQDYVIDGE